MALATIGVVGASAFMGVPAAHAAEQVITVNSLGLGGNADTSSGVCEATTGAGDCTLRGALEIANTSASPDGYVIDFDASLVGAGMLEVTGGPENNMYTDPLGVGGQANAIGPNGARFHINSQDPVSIDFSNLDGIDGFDDNNSAMFYIGTEWGGSGPATQLSGLKSLRAAEAGIVVSGQHVTISDVVFEDPDTDWMEAGVALLGDISEVTLTDLSFNSMYYASILVDDNAFLNYVDISGVSSRGVESGNGHIDFGTGSTMHLSSVTDSTFGALDEETSTAHAFFLRPSVLLKYVAISDNTVSQGAGPEKNVMFFEGDSSGSQILDVSIERNTFEGVSEARPLSRIVGDNTAMWVGLVYVSNEATFTRGILMNGSLRDVEFDGNTFTNILEPDGAVINLAQQLEDVEIEENLLDTVWALDAIRIDGAADNVTIEGNEIRDFTADVSRSAIAVTASRAWGSNIVSGNVLVQDLGRAGVDLPADMANHWAVYVGDEASAASASDATGWSILDNHIDGFGGDPAIASQGPITNNARGKTLITGNTFGTNTRGSFGAETENGENWFLWNDGAETNNRVQTFRAEDVVFDGSTATFTATQPAALTGNSPAVAPVTLHVYWTADDHAEEYLGAITAVAAGESVSIATAHTDGYLRVQTVDASGYTSQYSSIDRVIVVPDAPVVTDVTQTTAAGTGEPDATIEVRNAAGEPVGTVTVAADGTWTVTGLACGTDYTAVQTVDGEDSAAQPFTTAACDVGPGTPAMPTITSVTDDTVTGTGEPEATITIRDETGAVMLTTAVDANGRWLADASSLECGADYTATQTVGNAQSEPVEFTMPACAQAGTGDGSLATTGAAAPIGITAGALALLAVGIMALIAARRRHTA